MKKSAGKFGGVARRAVRRARGVVVEEFLPLPGRGAASEEKKRVTINLSASCVKFFKEEARRHGTPYQKIIRDVLDGYVRNATALRARAARSRKGTGA